MIDKHTKIFIDPRTRISYASYYIYGLYQTFGRNNVYFSFHYFKDLKQNNGLDDFDQYFAFVVIENKKIVKQVVIDYRDKNNLNINALDWCDVYGKVNFNSQTEEFKLLSNDHKTKVYAIGPNFGIKIWNVFETYYHLFINYMKGIGRHPVNFRTFFAGYNWQIKRMSYEQYRISTPEKNYIFFISTLYHHSDIFRSATNKFRAAFVRACKKSEIINFEGGLLARGNHLHKEEYSDVIVNDYVPTNLFLEKIRKSFVVFNTPAVWGCHGWKLGEFLAMGKAIISTPLLNEMPFQFEHGKQVHFVQTEEDIDNAVKMIMNDSLYAQKLEKGAKEYFDNYLAPDKIIEYLIKVK